MHTKALCGGLLPLVLVLAVALLPSRSAWGESAIATDAWMPIGPFGTTVHTIAVSPNWPRDPFVIARVKIGEPSNGGPLVMVRSGDGGQTWEQIGPPPHNLTALHAAPVGENGHVLFAFTASARIAPALPGQVFRSTDDGETWQDVLTFPVDGGSDLLLAPTFARDGLALIVHSGRLYRTTDFGATWVEVELGYQQVIRSVQFAPADAGSVVYGAVVSNNAFPDTFQGREKPTETDTYERSIGIVVSKDGGATWAPTAGQPEIDGVPHRHVFSVSVSPTFAVDRTVFAFAWGPRTWPDGPDGRRVVSAALFRSDDGGEIWTPVWRVPPFSEPAHGNPSLSVTAQVAPSPRFADDQTLLMIADQTAGSWRETNGAFPTGCATLRSTDGGRTWNVTDPAGDNSVCRSIVWASDASGSSRVWKDARNGAGWQLSTDEGQTWQSGDSPLWPLGSYYFGPGALLPDGTGFLPGPGGIWAFGLSVTPTEGMLPCPQEPMLGFARARSMSLLARAVLGCPREPEHGVRIDEWQKNGGYGHTYYIERWQDREVPSHLYLGQIVRNGVLEHPANREEPLAERVTHDPLIVPDRTVDGVVQRYDGGVMLCLPREDGVPVVRMVYAQRWEEVEDR